MLARRYAPLSYETMEVFECNFNSNRCIFDAYNIEGTGEARELLVLGYIPDSDTMLFDIKQ